jgi:1-acyl-sn-glycerol-3-phosphate acyltransferase
MTALRSALFALSLALTTVALGVLCLPVILFGREAARGVIQLWARAVLVELRILCGIRHRIEGAEFLPTGAALVAANHQSMWETVALFALLKRPVVVYKRELINVPVYGWWAKAAGGIPVDRKGGAREIKKLRAHGAEALRRGEQIVVFPEGTRGSPGGLLPLQPGVAAIYLAAGAPCTPVVHNSGEYWRHPGFRREPGEIAIEFREPIPAGLPRKEFMRRLEAALENGGAIVDSGAVAARAAE